MKELVNYFIVTAKCGHVGKNNFILKEFPVMAESGKDAAEMVRWFPRVKHHHKDAIVSVEKVEYEVYKDAREKQNNDLYFACKSIQEQNLNCQNIINEILKEIKEDDDNDEEYEDHKMSFKPKQSSNKYHEEYEFLGDITDDFYDEIFE